MNTPHNPSHDDSVSGAELAPVYHLPNSGEVLEGELVTPQQWELIQGNQKAQALERYKSYRNGAVVTVRTVKTAIRHERTTTAAKAVVRHTCYPFAGAGVVAKRWRDTHGANRYERMMRQAELSGNAEQVLEWEARDVAEKQRRHQRTMDWVSSPLTLVKAGAVAVASVTALLLALGIILAVADGDASRVLGPIIGVIDLIRWLAWFFAAYGAFLLVSGTVGTFIFLWNTGRKHTEPPKWAAPANQTPAAARDMVPDEGAILAALRNLNLAPLNRKIKEGWQPRWVLATGRDGKGWRTQLELPQGVTVEMILDKKSVLAHNLVRLPVEVWPTEPKKQPGVLDLWVADQGILTGPVEPYPYLRDGSCDYFKGVPVGIDQRGDKTTGKLMACNYAIAGIMGSGKTSLVLELALGAILDPLCDVDVYVMAFNADYDPLKPALRTLIKGDEDEQIVAAMDALRELRNEVTKRGKILSELGGDETKVTREMALKDARLRPRVVIFDECQELFRHEKFGEEAKQLAIKVMTKARKCALTLVFVTPAPSAESLPRDLAKTASHRVCFAIGDHQGNDAILGTGAHKAGITATSLVAGEDIGTAMASGFAARPGLLRTHHIRKEKGVDEVTPIVERALELRKGNPKVIESTVVEAVVDTLADIAAVLGEKPRMRTLAVLQQLVELNRATYEDWSLEGLTGFLSEHDAAPYKTGGVMQISAARIREAITERDELAAEIGADSEGDE